MGLKCYISTMYRGAVPITEHQPADVLEPLRGTGWRGHPDDPTKALRSGRFACAEPLQRRTRGRGASAPLGFRLATEPHRGGRFAAPSLCGCGRRRWAGGAFLLMAPSSCSGRGVGHGGGGLQKKSLRSDFFCGFVWKIAKYVVTLQCLLIFYFLSVLIL